MQQVDDPACGCGLTANQMGGLKGGESESTMEVKIRANLYASDQDERM